MNAALIWCPYSDSEIDPADSNPEHIIPLSLGGSNGFTVPVDASVNAKLGSDIDAALSTKDFSMMSRRQEFDARGHSNKAPELRIRNATYGADQRPAQVSLKGRTGTTVWDARDRRELPREELAGQEIQLNFKIQPYDRLRFLAKVALSAGYLIFGDLFRKSADHQDLRLLMNADSFDAARRVLADTHLRACFDYGPTEQKDAFNVQRDRAVCSTVEGSIVMAIPTAGSIVFTVSILGQWLGMVNVPATTDDFLNDGDHDLGHVVLLVGGRTERISYREFVGRAYEKLTGNTAEGSGPGPG